MKNKTENQYIFLLDTNKKQCNPVLASQARKLLNNQEAAVFRTYPFILILKKSFDDKIIPLTLKIDPGSKHTGICLLDHSTGIIYFSAEIEHRGHFISKSLKQRANQRRHRRNRKTRYRKVRFDRKINKKGWVAPSIKSIIDNILTWVKRLSKLVLLKDIWIEYNKFDIQKMENPEISGIEYQRGELSGFEIREYLLEKYNRECVYCKKENEIDHVIPVSKGGSNKVSNLVLCCHQCNKKKSNKTIDEFLKNKKELLSVIKKQLKISLKDASIVNIYKKTLLNEIKKLNLSVNTGTGTGTGAETKFNRKKLNLPKEHYVDAACVGNETPNKLNFSNSYCLRIYASGYGSRKICKTDKFGFPKNHIDRNKIHFGFKTGDIVKFTAKSIKGIRIGRVAVRKRGYFDVKLNGKYISTNYKKCRIIQKSDGFSYENLNIATIRK
jgi:5-methylcytosine-specific restriction endonuclease McrA